MTSTLTPSITIPGLIFRSIADADLPFLQTLYASTRQEEMAQTAWNSEQITDFLALQFRAQHAHYQKHYPKARFDLILMGKQAIGRLYLDNWPDEYRLIDLAFLPEYRNRGFGTQLLREILAQATRQNKAVRLHVEHFNPALKLYQRLGFRQLEDKGVYSFMEWRA